MIKQAGFFIIITVILFLGLINDSDALLQMAEKMVYELQLGESQTKQWGFVSEDDVPIVLELRAEGKGSELLQFPKTVELGPRESVKIDVVVSIPKNYEDNVELRPQLFALQRGADVGGATVINIQMLTVPIIKIGDNPIYVEPEKVEITTKPEQKITLEPGEEKSIEIEKTPEKLQIQMKPEEEEGGGCLIATATYGSELAQQVQMLREIRDTKLLATSSGTSFMSGFNQFYYMISPTIADWERQSPLFKEAVKLTVVPLLTSLSILSHVDLDSDAKVLGYGISIILLNVGMYFIAPVVVILKLRRNK